jgi:hypothetical protein
VKFQNQWVTEDKKTFVLAGGLMFDVRADGQVTEVGKADHLQMNGLMGWYADGKFFLEQAAETTALMNGREVRVSVGANNQITILESDAAKLAFQDYHLRDDKGVVHTGTFVLKSLSLGDGGALDATGQFQVNRQAFMLADAGTQSGARNDVPADMLSSDRVFHISTKTQADGAGLARSLRGSRAPRVSPSKAPSGG